MGRTDALHRFPTLQMSSVVSSPGLQRHCGKYVPRQKNPAVRTAPQEHLDSCFRKDEYAQEGEFGGPIVAVAMSVLAKTVSPHVEAATRVCGVIVAKYLLPRN